MDTATKLLTAGERPDYLQREITVKIGIYQPIAINISVTEDLEGAEAVIKERTLELASRELCCKAGERFYAAFKGFKLPTENDPGDEPVLSFTIEYADMPNDEDMTQIGFSVHETELFTHADFLRVIGNTADKARAKFLELAALLHRNF